MDTLYVCFLDLWSEFRQVRPFKFSQLAAKLFRYIKSPDLVPPPTSGTSKYSKIIKTEESIPPARLKTVSATQQ